MRQIELAAAAGVDWIQIREKDLSGRELFALTEKALRLVDRRCKVLVNGRLDVALAVGADGVHLGEQELRVADARSFLRQVPPPREFLLGASTHSLRAVLEAAQAGADYAFFGPVFPTPSKADMGQPQGVDALREVCAAVSIPVLAIGGVSSSNARDCLAAGAAGLAAIRLFQDSVDLAATLAALRQV